MNSSLKDDWRYTGQDRYLQAVSLKYCAFDGKKHDHEHCGFCFAKFSDLEGDLHVGYTTEDEYHWICEKCFQDFKSLFNWKIINN